MYRSMSRRNAEGQVSLAKWPTAVPLHSQASGWDVDDSTAQTVSKLNSYFGFRPPTAYGKPSARSSPDDAAGYSPELPQLCPDQTPELRHDTPSDARTRTSSFGPETPPTRFDQSFPADPHVQSLTPARHGHSHLRSYSDGCSLQGFESDHRPGSDSISKSNYEYKHHPHAISLSRPGIASSRRHFEHEPTSPHHNYAVNLARDNRAVTLCLTSGGSPNPAQPTITCYRQTYLPVGGRYAEFFKASDALALLQHMVNSPSQPFVPFSKRERSELMQRMRTSLESMILGDPCSNARAWTSFFSSEMSAGRAWEAGTVIFPWKMLQKLMNSLNAECAQKRRLQTRGPAVQPGRDVGDHFGSREQPASQQAFGPMPAPRPISLRLSNESEAPSIDLFGDRNSVASASPPPLTPTDPAPPRIQFMRERIKSPSSSSTSSIGPIRRRRQNSEPVRRLSLSPPRIALLKSIPCRQNLRRLHATSTPARLEFYDSIRSWPASSHRSRVRLPPCSKFLELAGGDRGMDPQNPIEL
ncbi:hypothetical protein CPLU01_14319 [Colletotrichum plurivorum]|uniref:Uncharacterized protein n=1 Tax=Colletotrichum plurivorum TaxID=2175906 RepID=A0A8H6JLG6_9PEZI|nr:hypothetical protein CPLU01_14319 [Colletotrichum plurivorum]